MFLEHQAALLQQKREFDEDKEKIEVRNKKYKTVLENNKTQC